MGIADPLREAALRDLGAGAPAKEAIMRMIRSNLDEREAEALAAYRASQQQVRSPQAPRQTESSGSVSYTVQPGDTLSGIAEWFYGDRSRRRDIYAANRSTIRDPQSLEAGTVLKIPREGAS